MFWKKLFALLCCAVLLTGCSAKRDPTQKALDFRTSLMAAKGCSFTAEVTANYEDRVYQFTLGCEYEAGETKLEVLAPEIIAGIKAHVQNGETKLEFEDVLLEFGKLANGYVSPVAVPWLLVQCWIGEYIAYAGPDGDQYRVTYLRGYNEEELAVDTWLRDGIPTYAEVAYDNVKCLSVIISDFQMN